MILRFFLLITVIALLAVPVAGLAGEPAQPLSFSGVKVPEGNDFATRILRDPWDLEQYADISQYINQSGQADLLRDISVSNGVFSARATDAHQASLHPLFPGYKNALLNGKVGANYPIDAAKYKCLHVAAKVDSGPPQNGAPDQMVVFWFGDESLNAGPYWGVSIPGIVLYPESPLSPQPRWKLYSLRLDQAPVPAGPYTRWENAPGGYWEGLRIDFTQQTTSFQVDWIRLTDCQAVTLDVSWSGGGPVSITVEPDQTGREILVASDVASSPYRMDVQGLEAGSYDYYVWRNGEVVAEGSFEVTPTPIANFSKPSTTSGADYASSFGNPWDMSDAGDVEGVDCMSTQLTNGVLAMSTLPYVQQPAACQSGGVTDPGVFLSSPEPIDALKYRYLSYRMYTDAPWQNVPEAMIVRWIWYVQGVSGLPANRCIMASYGVPYDVGWHTYTVDLHDALEGMPESTTVVDCPPTLHWTGSTPVMEVRWDPNENIMATTLNQQLDWVRLTAPDQVKSGQPFNIQVDLNVDWSNVDDFNLFYTTDPNQPFQNSVRPYSLVLPGPERLYLPVTLSRSTPQSQAAAAAVVAENTRDFLWDTRGVSPGQYYICVNFPNTGQQGVTYCSEVPVVVK